MALIKISFSYGKWLSELFGRKKQNKHSFIETPKQREKIDKLTKRLSRRWKDETQNR